MMRTGLIALAVVLASSMAGCKSKSEGAAKKTIEAEKPAPPEPQVPLGTVPVQLPTVHSDHARRVHSATAFVTIAKDGAIAQGKLAPGADPYAGQQHDSTKTFEQELFAGAATPRPDPTQDDPPPPEPDDPDPVPVRPQGQYQMKKPDDDAQLARQQAIDRARNAGVLGTIPADDVNIYGGLLGGGGPPTYAYAELDDKAGPVDVLILADRDATARSAVLVLDQLTAHKAALAVDGGDAPDALRFRFKQEVMPSSVAAVVSFVNGIIAVTVGSSLDSTRIPRGGAVDIAKLVSALRPTPMTPVTSQVHVELDDKTTVQELADVLAALTMVGAPSVRLQSNDTSEMNGGFGFGTSGFGPGGGGTGWGTIGTGTIGGGGGGYGVGSRSSGGSGPKVSIGQPNSVGDLDKAIIRRYIKRNVAKITYCYEKELLDKPDLEGTVKVQFFINPQGIVETSTATGVDDDVSSCVAGVIKAIEFPKPKGGGGVQVNYPFTFRATD